MAPLNALARRTAVRHAEPPGAAKSRPDALLWAIALMIWTSVWRIQDLVPIVGLLKLNLLATALALGLFVIDRDPARRTGWLQPAMVVCAVGLLCMSILGIPTSLWPRNSFMALVRELVPNLLLMGLLAASVRSLRDLEWLGVVMVLGACVYSLFALLRFGVDASGRLGDMAYYDANDLALVLLCTIPIALYLLLRGGWRRRLLAASSLALMGITFVESGSRGGFIALIAVLAFFLVAYRPIAPRVRLLAVLGGFGLFTIIAGESYWTKIRTLGDLQNDYNWSGRAPEGRMEVWRRGLGYLGDNPVLGLGLRNFSLAEGMLSEEAKARMERGRGFKWSAAHNSWLELGAELGVLGLLFFVGLLGYAFLALRRISRGPELSEAPTFGAVAWACTLSASLVGFCVAGSFISAEHFAVLYIVLGFTMALAKLQTLDAVHALDWSDADPPAAPDERFRGTGARREPRRRPARVSARHGALVAREPVNRFRP